MELGTGTLSQHDRLADGYESLLLSYAAGSLDAAQSLIVSTHLEFSEKARKFIHSCEAIGGALMETNCNPEDMSAGSLESVMQRLDAPLKNGHHHPEYEDVNGIHFDMPKPLETTLALQDRLSWKTLMPGFHAMDIPLQCKESTARFLKADPGVKSPHHSHGGTEITLVMDGAFSDETGNYKVGDLIVTEEDIEHAPIACKMQGCTCLVVSTAPIKLTGIASLLNPFLKP